MSIQTKIEKLQNHFLSLSEGKANRMSELEFQKLMLDDKEIGLATMLENLAHARQGVRITENGKEEVPAVNVSFGDFLANRFGGNMKMLLASFGINTAVHTLEDIASKLDDKHFNKNVMADSLRSVATGELSFAGSPQGGSAFLFSRGLIGELLIDMINRKMYQSPYKNWVFGTRTVNKTMNLSAFSLKREGKPIGIVSDGETPNVMVFSLDDKPLKIQQHKGRFVITEHLAINAEIDMVEVYLSEVRQQIAFSAERMAINTLVNGDSSVSSAPVIGVTNTANKHTIEDIERVTTRMTKLTESLDYVITNETLKIHDMNGALTSRERTTIGNYVGENKVYTPQQADDRGNLMTTVSLWVGFGIFKRDARVVLDTAQTWSQGTATDFPSYMDVYGQITNA
jgi:hypothetical protein